MRAKTKSHKLKLTAWLGGPAMDLEQSENARYWRVSFVPRECIVGSCISKLFPHSHGACSVFLRLIKKEKDRWDYRVAAAFWHTAFLPWEE